MCKCICWWGLPAWCVLPPPLLLLLSASRVATSVAAMANGVDQKLSKLERKAMRGDDIQVALLQLFNEYSMLDAATGKK